MGVDVSEMMYQFRINGGSIIIIVWLFLFPGGRRRKREVDDESNFFESDFGDDWFNNDDSFFGTEEEETTTRRAAQLKKKIGNDDTVPDSDFAQYDSWYFDIDSVASGPKSGEPSCDRVRCNVNSASMISEDMFRSFLQVCPTAYFF